MQIKLDPDQFDTIANDGLKLLYRHDGQLLSIEEAKERVNLGLPVYVGHATTSEWNDAVRSTLAQLSAHVHFFDDSDNEMEFEELVCNVLRGKIPLHYCSHGKEKLKSLIERVSTSPANLVARSDALYNRASSLIIDKLYE
jgi:hypothetical protein